MSYLNRPRDPAECKYKGLRNQSSTTCYLNSVLQVLFMTGEFREAVLSGETSHTSNINAELKDLFFQLENGSPTTEYIIRRLGIEDVWKQQDAAEYFEKMLRLASPEASEVFRGSLIHRTSCQCGDSTNEPNSFWTLNLPINNTSTEVYNVVDGLKGFLSQSKLTGDNQVYCDVCEAKADSTSECIIELYPKVLVLLLKRFEFNYYEMNYVKNNCPVDVPLKIAMPKGVSYELYATVDHVGSLRGGHYTATIQSPDDGGSWFNFNDYVVTPKNNFNPEKSQDGYLLFYRKTLMSDSSQEDHRRSSVDPAESMTNQNNADDGNADNSDDNFHATPSSPHATLHPEGLGGAVVTGVSEEVVGGVGDKELLTNEMESHKPGDHADQPKASSKGPIVSDPEVGNERRRGQRGSTGLLDVKGGEGETNCDIIQKTEDDPDSDGGDNPTTPSSSGPMDEQQERAGRADGTGGDGVRVGVGTNDDVVMTVEPQQPMKIERLNEMGGECMETVAGPTNEMESPEPGDHAVQPEASGTGPMMTNQNNADDGNADDSDDNFHATPSSPPPHATLHPEGLGGGGAAGRGEVRMGDTPPLEVGGKRMKIVQTNEIESGEPGDHAVQSEASGTGPMVSYPEDGVNERRRRRKRRGRRESMELLKEEGKTEGNVMERKHRKVNDNLNRSFSRMQLSCWQKKSKRGPGKRVAVSKNKNCMNPFMCVSKQTSDTE